MGRNSAGYGIALVIASALSATQAMGADPVKQWYAFVGGRPIEDSPNANDEASAVTADASGVYVVGRSDRGLWDPAVWDELPRRAFTAHKDVLVAKLSPDGKPDWYTFLAGGGPGSEDGSTAVALGGTVAGKKVLYVVGNTTSDWPQGPDCPGPNGRGGLVATLDASTGDCMGRTFIADQLGNAVVINAIAVDVSGNPYLAGMHNSRPCIVKLLANGVDSTLVVVPNPDDDGVCTYVGETTGQAFGIAVDAAANVYVTGALDFPVLTGGQESRSFIAKMPAGGSEVSYQDIGPVFEVGRAIALDASGAAYVAGDGLSDSGRQAFVKKVTWQGETIQLEPNKWPLREPSSTSDRDSARGIAVRDNGAGVVIYVVGDTAAGTWSWDADPPPPMVERPAGTPEWETEAWFARLDASLNRTWWTFMGSADRDHGYGVALDGGGKVYVAGHGTDTWPESDWGGPAIHHDTAGSWDFYVVRFDDPACPPEDACEGNPCLAKRAHDWGQFVSCVEDGLGEHYLGKPYRDYLNTCRDTYFDLWKGCLGDRFSHDELTVTDHLTGLVWEKKTNTETVELSQNDADVHDVNNYVYTWSANGSLNETGTAFETFLDDLNSHGFAGSNGWRLPTIAELQTLMNPSGDGVLPEFPNVTATGSYWSATSSPYAEGNCAASECAWDVIFENRPNVLPLHGGSVGTNGKSGGHHVRAVRGGR